MDGRRLGLLEVRDRERSAQAAGAALFEATFGEAVVDRCPGVRQTVPACSSRLRDG